MDDLEVKKQVLLQEIVDLDNKRIERDFVIKSIEHNTQILDGIKEKIKDEESKYDFAVRKREIYEKEKNIELDKKAELLVQKEEASVARLKEISIQLKNIEAREKDLIEKDLDLRNREVNVSRSLNELKKQKQSTQSLIDELKATQAEFNLKNENLRNREVLLEEGWATLDIETKEINIQFTALTDQANLLEADKASFSDKVTQFENRSNQLDILAHDLSVKNSEIESIKNEYIRKEQSLTDRANELDKKEKDLHAMSNSIETVKLELQVKERDLNRREKNIILKEQLTNGQ